MLLVTMSSGMGSLASRASALQRVRNLCNGKVATHASLLVMAGSGMEMEKRQRAVTRTAGARVSELESDNRFDMSLAIC